MPRPAPPVRRALPALALVLVAAAAVRAAVTPPAPAPATAPPGSFSAERAMRHVRGIARRPHPVASAEHARVRDYVVAELARLGAAPAVQATTAVGTRYPAAGRVENVVARLPGRRPGGPAVLLAAHYDGVAAGPAAADDGAGTAALLEAVRALRAGPPLAHDVVVLVSDGEEQGLLGAAAFVDEHPWARDVAAVVNLEARGTGGRSQMFQTGPGNLDAARLLAGVPGATATSLATAAYRRLPNDTDLSELDRLGGGAGVPALNFAFIGGVTRYHTRLDDVAHLDPGSLQHHGQSLLALARALGDGPLPRPRTGDAVFFTLPFNGPLVVFPTAWALPLAGLAALLAGLATAAAARRAAGRPPAAGTDAHPAADAAARVTAGGVALGAAAAIVAPVLGGAAALGVGRGAVALHARLPGGGDAGWSAIYAAAAVCAALAAALAVHALARRPGAARASALGTLLVWAALALLLAARLPEGGYLLAVPLAAVAAAALVPGPAGRGARWAAGAFAAAVVLPVAWVFGATALGLNGPGGAVLGLLVGLLAGLLAPLLDGAAGAPAGGRRRFRPAALALAGAAAAFGVGLVTVRRDAEHPARSVVAYARDADGGAAVLAAPAAGRSAWTARVLGPAARVPAGGDPLGWVAPAAFGGGAAAVAPAPALPLAAPRVAVEGDTTRGARRTLALRVAVPAGTAAVGVRALDGRVEAAAVDGRPVRADRYRFVPAAWQLAYVAPRADSGVALALTLPAGRPLALEVTAVADGLPPALGVPPRPADETPTHAGDRTVVRRVVRF